MSLQDKMSHAVYSNIFLTFQLCSTIVQMDFDRPQLLSLAIAAFCDLLLRSTLKHIQDRRNLEAMITHLQQYPDIKLQKVRVEYAVPAAIQEGLHQVRMNLGSLKKWLRIYYVTIESNPGKQVDFPKFDLAFYGSTTATIFLISPPCPNTPQQKFRLLHELGHMARTSQFLNYRELVLHLPVVQTILWSLCQQPTGTILFVFTSVLCSVLVLLQIFLKAAGKDLTDPVAENVADHFALAHLSHEDRVRYADYVLKNFDRNFPADQGLFASQKARSENIKAKLQLIQDERESYLPFVAEPALSGGKWWIGLGVIVLLALISAPVTPAVLSQLVAFTLALFGIERYHWWKTRKAHLVYASHLEPRIIEPGFEPQ